jgi:hypothetical protein
MRIALLSSTISTFISRLLDLSSFGSTGIYPVAQHGHATHHGGYAAFFWRTEILNECPALLKPTSFMTLVLGTMNL